MAALFSFAPIQSDQKLWRNSARLLPLSRHLNRDKTESG
jgi:hypothetical protein